MNFTNEQLVLAIHTANAWSADHGDGLQLLSLGTTRKIHSEDHRQKALAEIDGNIRWMDGDGKADEDHDVTVENLRALRRMVEAAPVGHEWISDRDNLTIGERMYREGKLT
jgi:hypothetical protein